MTKRAQDKLDSIMHVLNDLFGDRSYSEDEVKEILENVRDDIEIKIEGLE